MNNLSLKKIATATGFFLGAFTLSVLAESWTAPTCAAPNCNTGAPINVTSADQYKEGRLAIGKNSLPVAGADLDVDGNAAFSGKIVSAELSSGLVSALTLKVGGVDSDKNGYVLTNDGTGNVQWKAAASSVVTPVVYDIFSTTSGGDYTLGKHALCTFSGDHVGNNTVVGDQVNSMRRNTDGTWSVNISANGVYIGSKYKLVVYCI